MQAAKPFKKKTQPAPKYDPAKLPRTTKYDHIEGKLKTGPTVKDMEVLTDARVAKVRNEIFERVSAKKLNQMLAATLNEYDDPISNDENLQYTNQPSKSLTQQSDNGLEPTSAPKKPQEDFLLLDLREESEYEKFHIRKGELKSGALARLLLQPGSRALGTLLLCNLTRRTSRASR